MPLPTWIDFPDPVDIPSREDINGSASAIEDTQATVAAENAPIRILYGRPRIGAQIANILIYQGKLIVQAIWGEGPIHSVESFTIGNEAPAVGVTATHYTGAAGQTVNATLVAAFATIGKVYTDALPGIAYSVISIPVGASSGFPTIEAIVKGLLVYDPRTTLTVWSDNPSLCLADLITSSKYGQNRQVDWASVIVAANANDEIVSGTSKRRVLHGLAIDSVSQTKQHVEALRVYAGCFLQTAEQVKFIPNRPRATDGTVAATGIVAGTFRLKKRGLMETPTVIIVKYTDTQTIPWSEKQATAYAPGVIEGTTPRRESEISLPGYHAYQHAYREAVERVNHFTLEDLDLEWISFDEGLKIEVGNVLSVTHPVGLTNKPVRVTYCASNEPGRWRVMASEYDPASYSDVVQAEPTYTDTTLANPANPPALTGLTAVEEVYQLENGNYSSRILLQWGAETYPYLKHYLVEIYVAGDLLVSATPTSGIYRTGPVQESLDYQCRVSAVSSIGATGELSQTSVTPLGKMLVPGNVPNISVYEVGGTVYGSCTPAIDIDIWRYEWRYGLVGGSWETATLLDRIDGLRITTNLIPVGTWRVYVKALDSVGQYSAAATYANVTVTADSGSFMVDTYEQTTPQWENICPYSENLTAWTKQTGVTIGSDVAVAPDGVTSADRIIEATSTQRHYIMYGITVAANTPYTFTVYAKAAQRNFIGVVFGKSGSPYSRAGVIVNLTTGAITTNYLVDTVTSVVRHAVKDVGNGWFRISVTVVMDAASTDGIVELWPSSDGTASSYLGNTANGVYAWGAQLSQASYPHLYTKTTAAIASAGGKGMASYRLAPTDSNAYYVTDDDLPFADKFSSALSTYTNPLAQYHNDVTSIWLGENTDDFEQVLSGQWTITASAADISGSHISYLGLSNDGSAWSYYEGLSHKATGRFARVKHEALTVSTMQITVPEQKIQLDVIPRTEVGMSTSSLTLPKLVQLAGHYSAVKRVLVTAEGVAARIANYDRVLVAPDDGLVLSDTSNGPGDSAAGQTINTTARVIASGDYLEYDFLVYECPAGVSGSVGGFRIRYTDLTNSLAVDQYGHIIGGPSFVQGVWKSRKLSLPVGDVGKIVSHFALLRNADAVGDYKALYRNIRITDGAGTTRLQIWESGEPAVNTLYVNQVSSNIQCGPSNSFNVYVFDTAGAQTANDFSHEFQGV